MSAWCLTREYADKFIKGLRSGEIDPFKMAEMTSEDRHTYLSKFVGEDNAKNVNSLFESKLLLKNQQKGLVNWAKKTAGLTPEVRRDLISKIEKLDKVLNPEDQKSFLKDLASTKIGADVTAEEAKNIFDLSNKVKETRALMQEDKTFKTEDQRMAFGRAKVALGNYVSGLKEEASKLGVKGYLKNPIKAVQELPGITKSIRASMDNSAIFRQGWKTLFTHPGIWQKNARQSFVDIVKEFGNKKVMDEINADIVSRPNYDRMVKAKLAVSSIEEAYPTSLPEKIPGVGRAYKATETAYTGFVYRQRADIFDKYIQIAEKSGLDINNTKELQAIGSMVNSLTGRGNLGKYEPAANLVNNVFFSPRFVKSQIDTLLHPITGAGGSNFVRKQAAVNLVKVVTGTAGVLAVANALMPGSVETDPRSSDFGRIRVGDTRFDVTGGMSSLLVLAARLATSSSKSSTTGRINPLNTGKVGSQTSADVAVNFLENKLSPIGSVIKEIINGKDFSGNKVTISGELANLFVPLSVNTFQELKNDPNSANTVLAMIADGLGIATNTYGQTTKSWSQNPTKAQQSFLDKVGEKKFNEANQSFNQQYDSWFSGVVKNDSYKKLSDTNKQTLITNKKADLEGKIFKQYGFTYVQNKTATSQQDKNTIKRLTK